MPHYHCIICVKQVAEAVHITGEVNPGGTVDGGERSTAFDPDDLH